MTQSAVFTTSRLCSMTEHGIALVDQSVQDLQETLHVFEM